MHGAFIRDALPARLDGASRSGRYQLSYMPYLDAWRVYQGRAPRPTGRRQPFGQVPTELHARIFDYNPGVRMQFIDSNIQLKQKTELFKLYLNIT